MLEGEPSSNNISDSEGANDAYFEILNLEGASVLENCNSSIAETTRSRRKVIKPKKLIASAILRTLLYQLGNAQLSCRKYP